MSSNDTPDTAMDALRDQIRDLVRQYAELAHVPRPFVPGDSAVPVSGKVIGTKELQLMVDASLDGWLTTGRFADQFERAIAQWTGSRSSLGGDSGRLTSDIGGTCPPEPPGATSKARPGKPERA